MRSDYSKSITKNLRRVLVDKDISAADMSRDLGISKSTISNWMNGNSVPRGQTIDRLCNYLCIDRSQLVEDEPGQKSDVVRVKIYGEVAAGVPFEMIEDIYDEEEIPKDMTRGGKEYFGLVIKGDSMEPRMKSGDIVIALKQETAETGDTVIATVNGFAATCKKFRRLRDGIELVSMNSSYEPMYYSNEEIEKLPVVILGKVVELRAKI